MTAIMHGHGTPKTPPDPSKPSAVYRLFSASGELLYIGHTMHPRRRWAMHVKRSPWWEEVARTEYEWHPGTKQAWAAEHAAIRAEQPKYNIACNPRSRVALGMGTGKLY